MPFIPWIIAGIATLLAGGAIADDVDQRNKRGEDRKRFRREIEELTTRIAELELAHAMLSVRLGEKNQQVRAMAEEISQLRAELADRNRRNAA
jgi:chromosome segregation ATPase